MFTIIRKIAKVIRGSGARPAAAGRQFYKQVWTNLSATEGSAKIWVQGSEDEALMAESAGNDLKRLQGTVGINKTDDILEIGCGVGRVGKVVAPLCRTWTGCDVSANMLKYAAKRLQAFPNVRFVELSGYDLKPVASESMDVIYATVVFMHLSEWDRYNYIEDARRVLRPGGRLYVDNISLTTGYGWNFFQSSRAIAPSERPPQIGSTSTPQEIEVYLNRAGYRNIKVSVVDDAWVIGCAVK